MNPKRKASEFARTYHSKARVEFVKAIPCCICGRNPSENAHTTGGGMGRKGGYETIAPLCHDCHSDYDQHRAPFDAALGRSVVADASVFVAVAWRRASGRDGE